VNFLAFDIQRLQIAELSLKVAFAQDLAYLFLAQGVIRWRRRSRGGGTAKKGVDLGIGAALCCLGSVSKFWGTRSHSGVVGRLENLNDEKRMIFFLVGQRLSASYLQFFTAERSHQLAL
jgi:hypothetical protein